jgi:parvulin-like peptidyl-prolyl isomerase
MIKRLVREPLVHFLLLAALIFAGHGLVTRGGPGEDDIVVTGAKIEQLSGLFAKTWQRPPTEAELKGLIDDYVKEEIYVREAMRLGLDEDDTVIRRRLRLKMEFIGDAEAEAKPPTDAELAAYLDKHAEQFRTPPRIAFEQIYINAEQRGADARSAAEAILLSLKENEALAANAGDPTLLPPALPLTDQQGIAQVFGEEFAGAVMALKPGEWHGPVSSALGLHLVKVTERSEGSMPPLADIRTAVEREWANERRQTVAQQKLDDLLKRYTVRIEPVSPSGNAAP